MSETALLDVTVAGGKYRVVQETGGWLRVFQEGEEWRDVREGGLVLAMAQALREQGEALRQVLPALRGMPPPRLGDWDWPQLVHVVEQALVNAGEA